ncbi:hypothetical protein FJTKL_04175 [Diaporthe vaccinii]|uniref:Prokaryotic-type class I peptide chain release factors domain-containing protein n=1 Tax=Diaporthe vaccinii TaxID=105482 RepID=A0ABR4DUG0_9PEZI
MWWMKPLAPAGFARNSHGLSRHIVVAAGSTSIDTFVAAAPFSTTSPDKKGATRYPPRPKPPPEHEFTEVYLKGSGPGGQKINKTNSAVQLKHIPTGIVVKCQDTRSREQNRKLAREHLAEKIDDLLNGDQSRSAVVARLKAKKKSSAAKKSRRKHRDLADGREQGEEGEEEDDDGALGSDGADAESLSDDTPKRTVKIQEIRVVILTTLHVTCSHSASQVGNLHCIALKHLDLCSWHHEGTYSIHMGQENNKGVLISLDCTLFRGTTQLSTMTKTFRKYETRVARVRIVDSAWRPIRSRRSNRLRLAQPKWGAELTLEALAVDDGRTALVVLLLGDPHLLEGGKRGQNGTTDPDGVLSLGGSDDLDLHGGWCKSSDLLLHTVGQTRVHGGTTRLEVDWYRKTYHDNVAVQVLTDIDITLHDGVESGDVDATALKTQHRRLEQSLGSAEALVTDGDDLTVGKLVGLLEAGGLGSGLDLLLEVEGDVAELLLDVTDDFSLGGGGEGVATLSQDLHEVVGQVTTSHVDTGNGVGQSETLVDGDNVGDTITGVEHDTGGTTRGVQGQDGLDGDVEGGGVERLEDDLGHLLSVGLGVDGSLSQEDRVLLRSDTELVVEGVVPDLLHVVPVGDDTVLNGVPQGQDTTLGLRLITDIRVLLTHANHDTVDFIRTASCFLIIPRRIFTHGGEDDRQWKLSGSGSGASTDKGERGLTYGKQLEEHRHRRNRPCTYPNCTHVRILCS